MTLGLASPTCGLMHDSARANTQANHSRWHAHKCLMNNTDCVCHGLKVGAGFERREGETGANRVRHGAPVADRRHSQNGPEPRTVCGTRIRKRPTENSWALNFGGAGGSRTRVQRASAPKSTGLFQSLVLAAYRPTDRACETAIPLVLASRPRTCFIAIL